MAPTPRIPPQLKLRPFTLSEALAAGVSRTSLTGKSWRRLASGLYCWVGMQDDPWRLLSGWATILPRKTVFAGPTAAWLHGLGADPVHPVEVIVPQASGVRSRAGLTVRHSDALPQVVSVRGLNATEVHLTLCELCSRLPAVEALVLMDAALNSRVTDL